MRFKERLDIMNQLVKRVEYHYDHGDEEAYVPWDAESKALVKKLGYPEEKLVIDKYIKNEKHLNLEWLAYFVLDGAMWYFDGNKYGFHIDEKLEEASEREKLYKKAIEIYGIRSQLLMVIEECAELTKEICKNFRGLNNANTITEEIGDVINTLEQIQSYFGKEEVERKRLEKLTMLKIDLEQFVLNKVN